MAEKWYCSWDLFGETMCWDCEGHYDDDEFEDEEEVDE